VRVLITTSVGFGHVYPMVPLARALVSSGNDVRWATGATAVPAVEEAGLTAVAAGLPGGVHPSEVRARWPEVAQMTPEDAPDFMFGKLFGVLAAPAMMEDLVPLVRAWRPDLVVADAAELAGHVVAAELGVPSVTKGFGPVLPEPRMRRGGEDVAELWRSRGLEPRPYGGAFDHLYLDIYPPGLAAAPDGHIDKRQRLRPVAYDGAVESRDLRLPPGTGPLVYVTMGTVFNDADVLRLVVGALAGLDVRLLVTVGPNGDPDALGPQPDHVRVERFVPQTAVLPECDVVVSHGGSGTVLATLALGTPQLCVPQGADQFLNAAAVTRAGAGISLRPDEATPAAVAHAVRRLLADDAFRTSAHDVGAAIEAMPGPDEVAADVIELAEKFSS
jgi:UDP:flavonoid glycosyltransferase YjiC (YdhE family)